MTLTPQQQRLATVLPKRMRTLERDARGYPVPWIVLRDKSGQPQFTINDVRRTTACISRRLCAICGKRHDDGYWFIGGSRCFMHERGAFIDPPVHLECGQYALRVCPFLAAPSYARRIDDAKLKPENVPDGMTMVRTDHMEPSQPERFGLGQAASYEVRSNGPGEMVFVVARWQYVEWWRNGVRCNAPDHLPPDQPMMHFDEPFPRSRKLIADAIASVTADETPEA